MTIAVPHMCSYFLFQKTAVYTEALTVFSNWESEWKPKHSRGFCVDVLRWLFGGRRLAGLVKGHRREGREGPEAKSSKDQANYCVPNIPGN